MSTAKLPIGIRQLDPAVTEEQALKDTPSPVSSWLAKINTVLDVLADVSKQLTPPPAGDPEEVSPQEMLDASLAVLGRLEVRHDEVEISDRPGQLWGERLCSEFAKEDLSKAISGLVTDLFLKIGDAADKGASSPAILTVSDFGMSTGIYLMPSGATQLDKRGSFEIVLAVGVLDSLPADHFARQLLPAENYFVYDGKPALVLGPCLPPRLGGRPRSWYGTAAALQLTKMWRFKQGQEDAERAARERAEVAERQRQFQESELGRLVRQLAELNRLKEAGYIPDGAEDPLTPAVLTGQRPGVIQDSPLSDEQRQRGDDKARRAWESRQADLAQQEAARLRRIEERAERAAAKGKANETKSK